MAHGFKSGGRARGTPNRNRQALKEKIEAHRPGYDPLIALVEIATDESVDLTMRINCHKIVAGYLHPKPKPVTLDRQESAPVKIEIVAPNLA